MVERLIGLRALDVGDPVQGVRVPVHVIYPTTVAPTVHRFGLWEVEAALDAPAPGRLRLAAISHGTGGTPWAYTGLARHLAGHGFAVAMIAHPGNTRGDDALAHTAANLANRPRHVRLALDAAFAALDLEPGAAVVGHSMGGYTALAIAGGKPMALPNQTADGVAHPVDVEHDPRVTRVALLAPALPWLMAPGALANVHAKVFVRAGERDDITPAPFIAAVLRDVPANHAVVPGGGHFFCIGPLGPHVAGLPVAHDPPGFDRAAYLPTLYAQLAAFLEGTVALSATSEPASAANRPISK